MLHSKAPRGHVRVALRMLAAAVALTLPLALNAPVQAATRPAAVHRPLSLQLRALAAHHPAFAKWLRTSAAGRFSSRIVTSDPYVYVDSQAVPVVRKTCPTCTKAKTEQMTLSLSEDVASGNTYPVSLDLTLNRSTSKNGVTALQFADYSYTLHRKDFTYASNLSTFSLNTGDDLGSLGVINMTFAATAPATQTCTAPATGDVKDRPGSLSYGKFTFDTTNKFFGVVGGPSPNSEYPQHATLESNLGCTYPNTPNYCPTNGEVLVSGGKSNANGLTGFFFDGDLTSSGTGVLAISIIPAKTKYGAFSDGIVDAFLGVFGLPASDVQLQTEPTTAIHTTGDPLMVGSGHFTSTHQKQVFGPTHCKKMDGTKHTYTETTYSGKNSLLSSDAGTGNRIIAKLDSGSPKVPVTPAGFRGSFYLVTVT